MIQKVTALRFYQDRPDEGWQWNDGFVKMDTLQVDANDLIAQRSKEGWQGQKMG